MPSTTQIMPSLLFAGQAEEAVTFYTGLFPNSELTFIQKYGPEFPGGKPGTVAFAQMTLAGSPVAAMDSSVDQPFSFTPAMSFFVTVPTAEEVDRLFEALAEGGEVLMPLDTYPFSARYAWVADRFGVSWQLSVASE